MPKATGSSNTGRYRATLVPEVFLDFSSRKRSTASREAATTSRVSDEERERKTSGYLGLESHFHAANASNC